MGNSILKMGDIWYRWENTWSTPHDDSFHQKGVARSYTLLDTGDYAGSTQVSVGITSPKSEYISNNCVQDNNTGLMWLASLPSAIGPSSDGELRWDDHCDAVVLSGKTGSFVVGEVVNQSASLSALIRYEDNSNSKLGVINASATFSVSATITSPSASATVVSHTQGNGEDIWNYVRAANEAELAGYDDWRVPNFFEVLSILYFNYTSGNAYPDSNYFDISNLGTADYLLSSSHSGNTDEWVHATVPYQGSTTKGIKKKFQDTGYVYLVRGPVSGDWPCRLLKTGCDIQAEGFFPCDGYHQAGDDRSYGEATYSDTPLTFDRASGETVTIDQVSVVDNKTGLTWTKGCIVGESTASDGEILYYDNNSGTDGPRDDAIEFMRRCNEEKLCGFNDWRLPTCYEAASICDLSRAGAEQTASVFDNSDLMFILCTPKPNAPTATVFRMGGSNSVWGTGMSRTAYYSGTYVRLVRGG